MTQDTADAAELQRAFAALIVALEEFQRAYDQWAAHAGAPPRRVADLLAEAERKVDDARAALVALEERLRE